MTEIYPGYNVDPRVRQVVDRCLAMGITNFNKPYSNREQLFKFSTLERDLCRPGKMTDSNKKIISSRPGLMVFKGVAHKSESKAVLKDKLKNNSASYRVRYAEDDEIEEYETEDVDEYDADTDVDDAEEDSDEDEEDSDEDEEDSDEDEEDSDEDEEDSDEDEEDSDVEECEEDSDVEECEEDSDVEECEDDAEVEECEDEEEDSDEDEEKKENGPEQYAGGGIFAL
jgi:hypothetical protein